MILDIYAGGGGWDVAAQQLGLDPLGVEMDEAACLTRCAAGLSTLEQPDVRNVDLAALPRLTGLIASPPCQTFSMAGKGAGRQALEQVLLGVKRVAAVEPIPYDEYDDLRTGLVLEPLRYALELEPEWLAWEQVPTVQPIWDACAEVLRADGYSVWTGHLHAEQYGVPQTRKRSVLIASRSREMSQPPVTHSRFYSRNPTKLDEGVAKWVSMAEALGWGMTRWPSMTVTGGGAATGGAEPFGNAARQGMVRELEAGRWSLRSWQMGDVRSSHGTVRPIDQPSPCITSSMDNGNFQWRPSDPPTGDTQQWVHDEPAPTIVTTRRSKDGIIVGRKLPEGDGENVGGWDWRGQDAVPGRQNAKGGVRVTVQEAAILQSFPADYPWQGSKTKQYQQVGNALPPLLALHILAHVTGAKP